jgi:hypothetical protein
MTENRDSLQPRVAMLGKDLEQSVTRFLKRKQTELHGLRAAMSAGDFETIRQLGHDLREGYGFPELSILGAKFEVAAKARDAEQIAVHIATMERYLTRLQVRFG